MRLLGLSEEIEGSPGGSVCITLEGVEGADVRGVVRPIAEAQPYDSAAPGVLACITGADHGDVWLPFLLLSASLVPIISSCVPRWRRTSVATAARPGCTPSPTFGSSCVGAPMRTSTR